MGCYILLGLVILVLIVNNGLTLYGYYYKSKSKNHTFISIFSFPSAGIPIQCPESISSISIHFISPSKITISSQPQPSPPSPYCQPSLLIVSSFYYSSLFFNQTKFFIAYSLTRRFCCQLKRLVSCQTTYFIIFQHCERMYSLGPDSRSYFKHSLAYLLRSALK